MRLPVLARDRRSIFGLTLKSLRICLVSGSTWSDRCLAPRHQQL